MGLDKIRESSPDPSSEPAFKTRQAELQKARAALEARRKELRLAIANQLQDKLRAEDKARASALRERIDTLKKLEKMLTAQVEERMNKVMAYGRKTLDAEQLREQLRSVEEVQRTIGAEVERLKVEVASPERITLIEKAEVQGKE